MTLPKSHFWEYRQWLDPYQNSEMIRDHMLCAIIGTYANIRQREPEKYQDLKLSYLGFAAATGEARRIRGDYILTENDVEQHSIFQDAAAVNSSAFCLHYPGNPKYDFRLGDWKWIERDHKPYDIPFRCLYSADIDNLMMAGKHISVPHIVGSSVKLMGNCGQHGIAVGAAASLCLKYDVSPRKLCERHMNELKAEIEKQKNEVSR